MRLAAAVVVFAAVASFGGPAAVRTADLVERAVRASEWIARQTSNSWSVRRGSQRALRAALADDAAILRAFANHAVASVCVATIGEVENETLRRRPPNVPVVLEPPRGLDDVAKSTAQMSEKLQSVW